MSLRDATDRPQACPSHNMDVAALSVFATGWKLQARVVHKGPIQQWKNARSAGQLFHVCLVDTEGQEIAATFFNAGVELFHSLIQETQSYIFSGGKVTKSSHKYKLVDCELHINFDERANIEAVEGSSQSEHRDIPVTPLKRVSELVRDGKMIVVTICAVVVDRGIIREVTNRQGDIKRKRDVMVNDQSQHSMQITLWGEESDLAIWDTAEDPLILLGIRLQTCMFNESLILISNLSATKLVFNPSGHQAASDLRTWLLSHPIPPPSSSTPLSTIASLISEQVPSSHKITREIVAYINYIRHDLDTPLWYESCPDPTCKRRVRKVGPSFHCDRCNSDLPECTYRYCASLKLCDYTDGIWVSAFDDTFNQLIGISAEKAKEIGDNEPEKLSALVIDMLNRQYSFTLQKSQTSQQDDFKIRYTIEKITTVDQKRLTHMLLAELEGLNSVLF